MRKLDFAAAVPVKLLAAAAVCSLALNPAAFASDFAFKAWVVPVAEKSVGARAPRAGAGVLGPTTGIAEATTSLVCGETTYHIETGNIEGKCTGKGSSRTCTDGKGNSAKASCKGGCGTTKGSGGCTASKN